MMVPAMMTMPMRSAVPPNPFMIVLLTSTGFMPAASPTKKEANSKARKACTLKREISTTIMMIASTRMTNSIGPCTIFIPP